MIPTPSVLYTAFVLHATRAVLLAAVLAVFGCVTADTDIEPPEVFIVNLEPLDGTVFEQQLSVDLRVRNANDFPLTITGMDFELDVNGNRLTRALSNETVTVPRLGEATLTVTASTTLVDLLRQIAALQESQGFRYELRGRIYLRGAPLSKMSFERSAELIP